MSAASREGRVRDLAALAVDLKNRAFGGAPVRGGGRRRDRRVGIEVEFLAWDEATGRPAALESEGEGDGEGEKRGRTLPFLRAHAARHGWREAWTAKGTPAFELPGGGRITFEPGGQLEYSSPPHSSASALLRHLGIVVEGLRVAAEDAGVRLLAVGIDPQNDLEATPRLLAAERYDRMAEYFAALGPAGARMMRQTAALQVALDLGDAPFLRWSVLNRLAPYLVAIFANSPLYGGEPSGCQSFRASTWRELDSSRTGVFLEEGAPVAGYLEFALCAPDLLRPAPEGRWLPFCGWLARGDTTWAQWDAHLSTLFPEVRPRGYFEIRSTDAVDPEWYPAALAFLTGLIYDRRALVAAQDLLWASDAELLVRAGREGVHDTKIGRIAADLWDLAFAGCGGLGTRYIHPADVEVAREFCERYTRRGRAPADDVLDAMSADAALSPAGTLPPLP